ncbi:unnamed protein product [Bursaphelenchus okinawaensis]|uniref:Uncharacterized protein n=1 Tax=Bursaphelenchus okinawaensis TaxID=465554 RepID=A0A811LHS7_9BILA|nr:unnamed protein product [Bursaphelenchus okinawaensis]CAG9123501.1 unnamed protein product [Bursaphelenchus okinawaensis]
MGNNLCKQYPEPERQYLMDRSRCTRPRLSGKALGKVLKSLNINQIKTVAMINNYYFSAVRFHFNNSRVLNIDMNKHKICLSKKLCNCSKSMCGHRIIRKIQTWVQMINVGLIHPSKVYIHGKKKNYPKHQYEGISKILDCLNGITEIYIDLQDSATEGFVQSIQNLVVRCNDPFEPIKIFFKDGDIESCAINVPPFFPTYTNLLRFDQSVFPDLKDKQNLDKFLMGNDLHQYESSRKGKVVWVTATQDCVVKCYGNIINGYFRLNPIQSWDR